MSTEAMPPAVEALSPKAWAERPGETTAVSSGSTRYWYFTFFFISGFCSILYELIWLRLAMAQFGVTTAMVSIVLSTFMAGLGAGSLIAGHLVRKYAQRLTSRPLRLYAVAELVIGCSAVIVPLELRAGRFVLERMGGSLSSSGYYIAAGLWLACSVIPWCAWMGATIPVGMFAIRSDRRLESRRSFSFLYLANVFGAVAGALIPLLWVEIFGFSGTLQFGMVLNLAICAAAVLLASKQETQVGGDGEDERAAAGTASPALHQMVGNGTLWLLFATGLTSMGMEVVWTREYTPYVGTFVYSFATILGVYLAATFLGSSVYRYWSRRHSNDGSLIWLFVWLVSLIPLLTADSRVGLSSGLRVPLGIAAFSGLLGFITPGLVDRFSEGDPNRAGIGYAANVAGCILGPLVAGFALLPHLNERYALVALALPWLLIALSFTLFRQSGPAKQFAVQRAIAFVVILAVSAGLILRTKSYAEQAPNAQVRRDSTATVVAAGHGMRKLLLVNGVGMTALTPITKMIASMPLAFLNHPPQKALVICFGMGTTHRSMLSWGIDSTAVELVPSVPALFWYYHADGPELLKSPRSHVVIDDGRRFLERTTAQYDVIVIDPPPPIQAAGSSLLYSREFYAAAQKRLRPDGILQQWFPAGDTATTIAIARALQESFPYVRAFVGIEGWGIHFIASRQPIPNRTAAELAKRMPASAAADLVEWGPFPTAEQQFAAVLEKEISVDQLIAVNKDVPAMEDDRPVNEYYLLRDGWLTFPASQ
ncbi:MAG TPA: fused MFS/spermidine synthase [Terriglobales bacterium]|nr:fused MFS/spermidine synthase [Terriglobales bacterium]